MENKYRFNAKEAFLTYPQCPLEPDVLVKHLERIGVAQYCVVRETHQDGNYHLHAYAEFEKKKDWRDFHAKFDCQGYVCNNVMRKDGKTKYQKVDWLEYLLKTDPQIYSNFDVKETINAMKNHKRKPQEKNLELLTAIEEKGLPNLIKDGTISIMNYKRVKTNFEEYKADIYVDPRPDIDSRIETPWNMFMDIDPEVKKCHYWFYSSCPSLGKTTFALELKKKFRVEFYNYSEMPKFNPIPKETEMIVLDEFRGQIKISELNQMCDGTIVFGKKGCSGWTLTQKPIVLVLSNKDPQEVYKNSDISLINARFNIFDITNEKK